MTIGTRLFCPACGTRVHVLGGHGPEAGGRPRAGLRGTSRAEGGGLTGDQIRAERERRGMTMVEFAAAVGVSYWTLWSWERAGEPVRRMAAREKLHWYLSPPPVAAPEPVDPLPIAPKRAWVSRRPASFPSWPETAGPAFVERIRAAVRAAR